MQITDRQIPINSGKRADMVAESFSSLISEFDSKIDSLSSRGVTIDAFDQGQTVANNKDHENSNEVDGNIPGDQSGSVSSSSDRRSENHENRSFDSPILIRGRPVSGSKHDSVVVQQSSKKSETPLLHHHILLLDQRLVEQKHELIERMERLFGQTNASTDDASGFGERPILTGQLPSITGRDLNEIERLARSEAFICADCGLCSLYDNDTFSRKTSDASEPGSTSQGSAVGVDLQWDELDQDLFKLMHVLQRLTQILDEKERQLCVKRSLVDRMAVRKCVRQLKQWTGGIGFFISKSMSSNRIIILRDAKCTYHIEGK